MENDRWTGFGWGVAVGLLIGASIAGGFAWTGLDYRGETTPYKWPCISSHFGILDMCGFPKDNFYYYSAWWGNKPVLYALPHWNWPGKEGQEIIDVETK